MSPSDSPTIFRALEEVREILSSVPVGCPFAVWIDEAASTSELEARPELEIVCRTEEEYRRLNVVLLNREPKPNETEFVRNLSALTLCLISPEWTNPRTDQAANESNPHGSRPHPLAR